MNTMERGEIWGIVLAAGDGTRLAGVTPTIDGTPTPKQFCALVESRTLLRATLDRMSSLVPRQRIVVVVAEGHRRFWQTELADWPSENLVSQPENRGTAAGLLLPLLTVAGRDPEARIVVAPADHYVGDEASFLGTIAHALSALERPLDRILLLGVEPDRAETGYGWIVPRGEAIGTPRAVERFVEKPAVDEAVELAARGGVWNSFVVVARIRQLLELYAAREPRLLADLSEARLPRRSAAERDQTLADLYRRLPERDFSRDLLAGAESRLGLVPVPPCRWTDLGTPERLAEVRAGAAAAAGGLLPAPRRARALRALRPEGAPAFA
jgi:mannose-1-phosphate guanylyltransferase